MITKTITQIEPLTKIPVLYWGFCWSALFSQPADVSGTRIAPVRVGMRTRCKDWWKHQLRIMRKENRTASAVIRAQEPKQKKPRFFAAAASILMMAATVQGCASSSHMKPAKPVVGPAATAVSTDYSKLLQCTANHVKSQNYPAPRIAVGHISDLTGASDYFSGKRLTQGATLMAMTALSDAGMRLVERFDMGILQVDLDLAKAGLVQDSAKQLRQVRQGQIQGADLYVVGGLTEFNPNIVSGGADLFIGGTSSSSGAFAFGRNYYIIDVGIDLRLVDARTSEVLSIRSFRKQIVGYETEVGTFDIIGSVIGDIGAGKKALEPVQTAVRSMIDRAMFEFVAGLYNLDVNVCGRQFSTAGKNPYAPYGEQASAIKLNNRLAATATAATPQKRQPQQQLKPAPQQPAPNNCGSNCGSFFTLDRMRTLGGSSTPRGR